MRRDNAASVLWRLLSEGPQPRVDLASALGLTTGAVTRITAEMAERGLIRELDPIASPEAGRRRIPLDVRAEDFLVAGIHVGLDLTTYGLVDLRGRIVGETHLRDHGPLTPRQAVVQAVQARDSLLEEMPNHARLIGAGFVSGGFEVRPDGVFAVSDMLGWEGEYLAPLRPELTPGELQVDSAYRALSRAEMWFGATREVRDFVQIFLGNLVGASIVVDRQIHDGAWARAGRIAHLPVTGPALGTCICGRTGCFSSVAGLDAVLQAASAAGLEGPLSWAELMKRSNEGDAIARRFCDQRLTALGDVVAILIDLLAPERVVLSGGAPTAGHGLEVVRSAVESYSTTDVDPENVITPTALGQSFAANIIAAATVRLESFYRDPIGETNSEPVAGSRSVTGLLEEAR